MAESGSTPASNIASEMDQERSDFRASVTEKYDESGSCLLIEKALYLSMFL
jgi:hypothetical protein